MIIKEERNIIRRKEVNSREEENEKRQNVGGMEEGCKYNR